MMLNRCLFKHLVLKNFGPDHSSSLEKEGQLRMGGGHESQLWMMKPVGSFFVNCQDKKKLSDVPQQVTQSFYCIHYGI